MAYTTSGSVTYDTAAYDRLARYALRPQLFFDGWADVKPTNPEPGSSVTFYQQSDLAVATTPLTEDVDVTPVALSNTSVTVTPLEYGNATVTTARLLATSRIAIDPIAANAIGYNAGISIDTIAGNAWAAGTNVSYASTATNRATVGAAMVLTSALVRRAFARLQAANVMPFENGLYVAMIHPNTAYDLKSETGETGWRAPQTYGAGPNGAIANGEIGAYEGFRFIVSPRAPEFTNAGVGSTVEVYRSLFFGREAMAKAHWSGAGYGPDPVVVRADQPDLLRRHFPIGWKHAVGYAAFRADAMQAVEHSSSIATNT